MLTINEVTEVRKKNPNLSILEVLAFLQEKYHMDEHEVGVFVKSNKTFLGEVTLECANKGMIKVPKQAKLEEIF